MRLVRLTALATGTVLGVLIQAWPAQAQVRLTQPRQGVGVRLYAVPFEIEMKTASESFEAVIDRPYLIGFGGGAEVLRLVGDLFVRGAIAFSRSTGSRVVVVDDEVIDFDPPIGLTLTAMPIELAAGWRFTPKPRLGPRPAPASRVVPYLGAGLLFYRYREASEFDEPGEGGFENFQGYTLFGGVEFPLGKSLVAAGEVQYRTVPNALGDAGVSALFEETDFGGIAIRFLIGFRK